MSDLGDFVIFCRFRLNLNNSRLTNGVRCCTQAAHWYRGIAQPGRAPGLGPGGREFESPCPDQLQSPRRTAAAITGADCSFTKYAGIGWSWDLRRRRQEKV